MVSWEYAYPPYHIPQELILSTQIEYGHEEAEGTETGAAREDDENHVTENVASAEEEEGQPGSVKVGVWPP